MEVLYISDPLAQAYRFFPLICFSFSLLSGEAVDACFVGRSVVVLWTSREVRNFINCLL